MTAGWQSHRGIIRPQSMKLSVVTTSTNSGVGAYGLSLFPPNVVSPSSSGSGLVQSGTTGQAAIYAGNGPVVSGITASLVAGANTAVTGPWPNQTVTGTPIYQHTLTLSAGAATMVVTGAVQPAMDDNNAALNANATFTSPAAGSMAIGERLLLHATTSGAAYSVDFDPGAGVTLTDSTVGGGNALSARLATPSDRLGKLPVPLGTVPTWT